MSDVRRSAAGGAESAGQSIAHGERSPGRVSVDVASLSFEDALSELEQIVRGLEGGQQKLEDAIAAYERGAALRRHCEAKLAEAEARVAAIVERADGSLALRPAD